MRTIPLVLTVAAVAMICAIVWRLNGGPLGPRSYGFIVVTIAVIVAALMSWRRARGATTTTAGRI
jgi:hypothetical protein